MNTDLKVAIIENDIEEVERLLQLGFIPDREYITYSILSEDTEMVRLLLQYTTLPLTIDDLSSVHSLEIIRLILERIDNPDPTELSRLLSTNVRYGQTEIVHILLEAGAQPRVVDTNHPLIDAIHGNHPDIVTLLLDYGVDVNMYRGAPLRVAIVTDNFEMVQHLLDQGALLQMDNYLTDAIQAVSDMEIIDLLLTSGTPVEFESIALAIDQDDSELLLRLLEFSPDSINIALQWAIINNNPDILEVLLNTTNLNQRLIQEMLWLSLDNRNRIIISLLLEAGATITHPMMEVHSLYRNDDLTDYLLELVESVDDYTRQREERLDTRDRVMYERVGESWYEVLTPYRIERLQNYLQNRLEN